MSASILVADAVSRLGKSRRIMKQGEWGDGVSRACFLTALEPDATDLEFFVYRGWPWWVAALCVNLYDAEIGTGTEQEDADRWAVRLAARLEQPVDYDRARDEFLSRVMARVVPTDTTTVCATLHSLIVRGLNGEDVDRRLRMMRPRIERMKGVVGLTALNAANRLAAATASDARLCIWESGNSHPGGRVAALRQELARQREDLLHSIAAARV